MEQPITKTAIKQLPSRHNSFGYDILRSSVFFARTKCCPFFVFVTFAIFPFMSIVYNLINFIIIFTLISYPDFLVNVLYVSFVPVFSFMSAVFNKYFKDLWWALYNNIIYPIMPIIIGVAGYVGQITVNITLSAVQHLGYNDVLRILIFVLILFLLQFFNVLIYILIQIPTELLQMLLQ